MGATGNTSIDPAGVRGQLRRIVSSQGFAGSTRLCEFLSYIVEEQVAGRGDSIKEYVVGVEVYRKPKDYDPRVDAAVRVDASKLRARLERYYEDEGRNDPIRITVPKGGYVPSFEVRPRLTQSETPAAEARPRYRGLILAAASTAACALLVGGGVVAFRPRTHSQPEVHTWALTDRAGEQYDPALSPDGSMVAFSWNGEKGDNFDIYVKPILGSHAVRLTQDPGHDYAPAWSPDGQQIAFVRKTSAGSTVMVMPALGGAERPIAPGEGNSVAWTRDSRWLIITRRLGAGRPYAGYLTSVETGEQRQITFPPTESELGDYDFTAAPDGHTVAFSRGIHLPNAEIWTYDLRSGKGSHLRTEINLWGLAWTPDGAELVYSTRTPGIASLWLLKVSSGSVAALPATALDAMRPSVAIRSPGADRVAYLHMVRRSDLMVGPAAETGKAEQIAAGARESLMPQFSPDGQRIAFASNRAAFWNIWTCRRDGSDLRNLTPGDWLAAGAPRWSPDGTKIVFDARQTRGDGHRDIYLVNADGSGPPRQFTHDQGDCTRASWSSDGQSIYFNSARGAEKQIWKAPAAGGRAVQMTTKGGFDGFESADGVSLVFSRAWAGTGIWRMPAAGGQEELLVADGRDGLWGVTGRGLMFVDQQNRLCTLDLHARTAGCGLPIDKANAWQALGFSRDGSQMIYTYVHAVESEMILLEGHLFR